MIRLVLLCLLASCASKADKIVIAHRGASGYLPEHTLEAAVLAHSWNVDFIEPDLVATKDGKLVVLHDIHLDTTTDVKKRFPKRSRPNGRFYAIDFTLNEIKSLTVTERRIVGSSQAKYPNRFPIGISSFKVPTFSEFIELVVGLNKTRQKKIGIYPEIKSPQFHRKNGIDITKLTLAQLKQHKAGNDFPIFLQCFDSKELIRMKNKLKVNYSLIQLMADNSWNESSDDYNQMMTSEGLKEVAKYARGIGMWIPHLLAKKDIVKNAHQLGLKVHAYTVRKDDLPRNVSSHKQLLDTLFKELNVDGVFSDFGNLAVEYLSN